MVTLRDVKQQGYALLLQDLEHLQQMLRGQELLQQKLQYVVALQPQELLPEVVGLPCVAVVVVLLELLCKGCLVYHELLLWSALLHVMEMLQ